ncbi:hypothetical protein PM082_020170 [Marasmius tenuissimus]|nr:hypothetical protein PM082_020170 [Marasmius tenuissimus]
MIQHALDVGLLKVLYYGKDRYSEMDRNHGDVVPMTFTEAAAKVVERISVFLVHSSVMRSFIRSTLGFSNHESSIAQHEPGTFEDAWTNMFRKGEELMKIRRLRVEGAV